MATFRSGQYQLVSWLRDACMLSTDDYTILSDTYWSDDQVSTVLDRSKRHVKGVRAVPLVTNVGGSAYYYEYQLPYKNFESYESGTSYFRMYFGDGTEIGTALYTLDAVNGIVYFTDDTEGSAVYADLTLYNVAKTAATLWRLKAAHISENSYDVKLGDHNLSRSQRVQLYMELAAHYDNQSGFASVPVIRTDIVGV